MFSTDSLRLVASPVAAVASSASLGGVDNGVTNSSVTQHNSNSVLLCLAQVLHKSTFLFKKSHTCIKCQKVNNVKFINLVVPS